MDTTSNKGQDKEVGSEKSSESDFFKLWSEAIKNYPYLKPVEMEDFYYSTYDAPQFSL
jgi:hypothetical protein